MEKTLKKTLTMGNQKIAVRHFTTEITNLPFILDANCFIVFSHLWRRYDSSSANEHLITEDGWFQYTMKSLMMHCGFGDKGTLQRAVEGLYRSKLIDVRVENGSRMWACWKMNKPMIERVASIPNADAMQEPFLNSICAITSKDKNFTYLESNEGIEDLKSFFGVQAMENPPLFNTITQQHLNTSKHHNYNTTKQQHFNTSPFQHDNTSQLQNSNTSLDYEKKVNGNSLKEEFEVVTERIEENQNEPKSQIEGNDDSLQYQPLNNKLLTPSENEEISKAFRTLKFFKPPIDTNVLKECLDLLHEVSQSNRENYMDCLVKANSRFKQLLGGYTKEERKPITKALLELSSILGEAFKNKDTKQK